MILFIGLSAFACFLIGMPGTIPAYRDAGDMISAAWTLGIAHPPGYPTYVLLAKLSAFLTPFANVAFRINLFSALCGAGAAALLYSLLPLHSPPLQLGGSARDAVAEREKISVNAINAVVVFLWVLSPAALALCRVSEMYALAALLAAAIVGLCARGEDRSRIAAAFLLGVGMGAHPTIIFLTPLLFFTCGGAEVRTFRQHGSTSAHPHFRTVLSFLAGFSILLFLPIRAAQKPLINWGDPSTLERFWRVITRADYGGFKLHPEQSVLSWTPMDVVVQISRFLQSFGGELGWAALILGAWGAWKFWQTPDSRRWVAGLLLSWGLLGPGFFVLSNLPWTEKTTPAILQPYLLLVTLLWIPLVAKGAISFPGWRGAIVLLLLVAAHPRQWSSAREDFLAYDYGRNLMRSLPPGAVLYDPDDPTAFTIRALQVTEQRRTDVIPLNFFRTRWGYEQIKRTWPDLLPPIPLDNAQALQQALWTYSIQKRPFYAELPQKFGGMANRSEGLVYRALLALPGTVPSNVGTVPRSAPGRNAFERAEATLALAVRRGPFHVKAYPDFFSRQVLGYYAAAHSNLGLAYAEAGRPKEALHHYLQALAIDPDLVAALNNRGILAYQQNRFEEAIRHYEAALRIEPRHEGLRRNLELARVRAGRP